MHCQNNLTSTRLHTVAPSPPPDSLTHCDPTPLKFITRETPYPPLSCFLLLHPSSFLLPPPHFSLASLTPQNFRFFFHFLVLFLFFFPKFLIQGETDRQTDRQKERGGRERERPMGDVGKPVLQKPPGYRDPSMPAATARPPLKRPQLPPALRHPVKPSRRHRTGRSCCCRLCCCLILLIILFIVLFAAAAGFGYLWFHPHLPSFRVENVTVTVFKITSRSDGTFLDATVTVKIQADNPNSKLGLSYRAVEGKVALADEDGEVDLGTGSSAGFTLGKKNSTAVRMTAVAKGVLVDDSVGARLKARYKRKEILFTVEMRMKVGFVINSKSTPRFPIRVKCAAVSLKQIESARPLPKCDIDFFNGIF